MTTFVLVHGAWHGGWCWQRVVPLLEREGHAVQAPTLGGLGERAPELTETIGRHDHVDDVIDVLRQAREPVTLVGHSYAGLVVRDAALQMPAMVRELVLLEGWIGVGDESLLDLAPDWFAQGIRSAAEGQGGWLVPVPDPAVVGVQDPADAAWLRDRLTPHPLKTFTDRAHAGDAALHPTRAILASPGPVPFDEMASRLGIPTARVEGGHDLMVTSPKALTAELLKRT